MDTLLAVIRVYKSNYYCCIAFVFVVCLFYALPCGAQTISAVYTTRHLATQVNLYENNKLVKSYSEKLNIPNSVYKYTYSNKRSLYTLFSTPAHINSSVADPETGESTPHILDYPTHEVFFKDYEHGTMKITRTTRGEDEVIDGALPVFHWNVTDKKKIISNHLCKMATCTFRGVYITAWYATDIRVKDGPSRFNGLPGLIVRVRVGHYLETTATNITILPGNTEILPFEDENMKQ